MASAVVSLALTRHRTTELLMSRVRAVREGDVSQPRCGHYRRKDVGVGVAAAVVEVVGVAPALGIVVGQAKTQGGRKGTERTG